ncbi:MAG: YdbH domain-containing protein [Gammaproteobacteria bacterium]|nr:YdbH domain-containing protein [Gammaproteobacteria bacterium]
MLRIFLVLIVIFLGGGITAWWNSPVLIEHVFRSELASNGFDMPEFVMARPYRWLISIDNITVVSPDIEIRLSEIKIGPINAASPDTYVVAKRATFQTKFHENDTKTSLDWQTLIESINRNVVFLPLTGEIEQLQWCLQECLEGRLNWNRTGAQVKAQLHIPDLNMSVSFSWRKNKSTITVTGYSAHLFLIEAEFVPEEKEINIDGHAWFRANTQPLKLRGESPFNYELDVNSLDASVMGHLPLDGMVSASAIEQQLQAKITINGKPTWQVEIEDIRLSSRQLVSADIEIHEGVLKLRLTKQIDINLETPFLEQTILTVDSGTECAVGENISCTIPHASLTGRLNSYDVFTSFSALQFKLDKAEWQVLTTVELDLADGDTPLVTAVLELTADNADLHANARTVSLLGVSADKIEVNHNLKTGKGQVTVNVTRSATEFQSVIDYLQLQKLKFASGELSLEANFGWDLRSDLPSPVFDTRITATDLDVIYDDYQLRKGSFTMQLAGWPRIKSTQPVSMSWQRFDIGVPLDDIHMSFNLELDPVETLFTLTGHTLDAEIFGGNINSEDYDYEVTTSTGHLNLNLEKLELNQILALQEEEFESTGKISGSVPVHINKGKLNVSKGKITAIAPGGFIKYKPSQAVVNLVAQNDQLKVVVDTMSDFQYHSLEAVLEYSPEGDLVARTALKGSNPAYENGREIHLNIKVEENLATLLKSLRLGDELARKIGEKAKRGVQ